MPYFTRMKARRHLARLDAAFAGMSKEVQAKLRASPSDWRALQETFQGQIVVPTEPEYEADRRGNSLYPDLADPLAIAYCEVESDVADCLAFCEKWDLPFAVRSGGHSTAGFSVSPGLVIDISRMNGVTVDTASLTAVVQAGASLGKVNATIGPYGLHIPGGECDTVCVAGHMQGGGYGFTTRLFGLNLDAVQQVRVMLANQGIVTASRTVNPDLFWAVRGGTGGNFGVLLEVTYRLVKLGTLWGACLAWPATVAPQMLTMLQQGFMRNGAPPQLGYQLAIARYKGATWLFMMLMFNGSREQGMAAVAPLLAANTPTMLYDRMGTYNDHNESLIDAWFTMPPDGTLEVKTCAYIARTLQPSDWQNIINYFDSAPNPFNMIAMEVYGGAVSAVSPDDCAFIHRQVDVDVFIDSFCNPNWSYNGESEARQWLAGLDATLKPYWNGERYQNYPDPTDLNYRAAYWGSSFADLLWVKQKYDPDNRFRYPQSVSPQPGASPSGSAPRFSDRTIVYEPHAPPRH